MRQLLRAAGRAARRLLWIVKGLLLLAAAAALAVWPLSRGQSFLALGEKQTVRPGRGVVPGAGIECRDGWISAWYGPTEFIGSRAVTITAIDIAWMRGKAVRHDDGWVLQTPSGTRLYFPAPLSPRRGPFRWFFPRAINPLIQTHEWEVGARCWLVAAVLAAWPVTSIALAVRRRRRRRRERVGYCLHCGYDLRATPSAGGELLARCPECGAAARPISPLPHPTGAATGQ